MVDMTDQPLPIEDYALIGDCRTAALVGRNGAIDWLCWPRFDSPACFAALLGEARHGRWLIAPADAGARVTRRYSGDTMVLETLFDTAEGRVALIDFMPVGGDVSSVVRIVEGRGGRVPMRLQLRLRFDYGSSVPWVTRLEDGSGIVAIAGPHLAVLRTPVALRGEDLTTVASFMVGEGERIPFVMSHGPSRRPCLSPPTSRSIPPALSGRTGRSAAPIAAMRGRPCCARC
jgi:GH15 family glucan-1,4-alpha-glucosidase